LWKLVPQRVTVPYANDSRPPIVTPSRLDGAKGGVGFITAISDNHFCEKCNRVRLTADGKIRPCLFSAIEVDFLEALRSNCSDEDIDSLYDQVLGIKPQAHELDKFSEEKMLKAMVNIGG
jgi:cyclic pyranopterin phosphate synthase